jgi:hypothetical protein
MKNAGHDSEYEPFQVSEIGNRNGAVGMSDMAGNAARVAVECGGRCRDTNRQSQIRRSYSKQGRPVSNRRGGQTVRLRNTSFLPEREFELLVPLSLPAVAGFSSVKRVARSITTLGTLLQRASHAQTGILIAMLRAL